MNLQLDWLMNNDGEVFVYMGGGYFFQIFHVVWTNSLTDTCPLGSFIKKGSAGWDGCCLTEMCEFVGSNTNHALAEKIKKNFGYIWPCWSIIWKKQEVSRGRTQEEMQLDALYIMHPNAMKYIKVKKRTLPFSVFQGHTHTCAHINTKQKLTRNETRETAYSMGS